jgi:hypothetical protein
MMLWLWIIGGTVVVGVAVRWVFILTRDPFDWDSDLDDWEEIVRRMEEG